jgi:lysyl-tRNA synthetase class 1
MNQPARNAPAPKTWPFEEAAKLVARMQATGKSVALFETGYGPSGLPHIGTFGEVARTTWVRQAFTALTGLPSRLIAFSDDMDGMRKVPDNVPNRDRLREFLGRPLTDVPDPFGTHDSFGAHNNARLRAFLDGFGFDYEFISATDVYRSGGFDAALRQALHRHDEIVRVVLPTLRAERQATYSPILPIHPRTGIVMQVLIEKVDAEAGTVGWRDPEDGTWYETPVTGGGAKMQWKADWAMRWAALGVDYEMAGKDHIEGIKLSGAICRILGAEPPAGFNYELFLDDKGQKISKSKGNGLSIDEWLKYAPAESLSLFMFNQPQRAKRLFFDVIPRAVDDYLAYVAKAQAQAAAQEPVDESNPAWFIHGGRVPPDAGSPIGFGMLLNLASVVNAETPDMLWGFIRQYSPDLTPETAPFLGQLVGYAIAYYQDFVRPKKQFRAPTEVERAALADLAETLRALPEGTTAEAIQTAVYEVGKRHPFPELKAWFGCLYQVLLGQTEGPRFGGFVALYGVAETVALIEGTLARLPSE